MKIMSDKKRAIALQGLSLREYPKLKTYTDRGCYLFYFTYHNEELRATIDINDGIITGVENYRRSEVVDCSYSVVDNAIRQAENIAFAKPINY